MNPLHDEIKLSKLGGIQSQHDLLIRLPPLEKNKAKKMFFDFHFVQYRVIHSKADQSVE